MSPDKILDDLYQNIAQIVLQQRAIHSVVSNQWRGYNERVEKESGDDTVEIGGHRMAFRDPIFSDWKFYGEFKITLSMAKSNVLKHENRQYQWLLAEAYEEFENFLEKIYASVGSKTRSLWPAEDYGNVPVDNLDSITFEKCLNLVRAKKRNKGIGFILTNIRRQIPHINRLERDNATEIDLKLSTAVIAQLRHHIVHTRGYVNDLNSFKRKALSEVGRTNNGKPDQSDINFINNFFRYKNDPSWICLVRIPVEDGIFHFDILNNACNLLLSHAYLIAMKVDSYISSRIDQSARLRLKEQRLKRKR
jgi:hypothetical protein